MGLRDLLFGWLRSTPLDACPACGADARRHRVRTLARERLSAARSGIEAHIDAGDFAAAAALDDASVLGDQLVHQLIRCGDRVAVVSTEDPVAPGLDARVRRIRMLDGVAATLAWQCGS